MHSIYLPKNFQKFPSPHTANEDGLLAVGGNLNHETLIKAYTIGTFPWFNEGDPIMWFHPDPRMVVFPAKIKISHSMRNVINKNVYQFNFDTNFTQTIRNCRFAKRKGFTGESTWISDEIEAVYTGLFSKGYAHSAEAWQNGELVGGLYGVALGKVFFGESMFSNKNNASKFAFIKLAELLQQNGFELIDCQMHTSHLESLGGELISRNEFISLLKKFIV